ncbi:hypothetical protein GAYE_SCF07G2948 [Galdieria yellowstonensis]|uniref:Magnesium transport protein CorA n=1 Tax=Galdieria yellowstonensis TaxID=3028027 RepID=A0AAV9ICN6_9RHOD|nr:hypothetical protein GAYE_SCF07G2948 [Galdieria yellowstonensis]
MAPDVFSLDADSKVTRNTTTEETETHPLQVPRREPRGKHLQNDVAATWSPDSESGRVFQLPPNIKNKRGFSSSEASSDTDSSESVPSEKLPPKHSMSVLASSIQNLGRRYLPHDSDDEEEEEKTRLLVEKPKLHRNLERSVTIDFDGQLGSRLGGSLSSKVASVRGIKGSRRSRYRHRDALRAMIEAESKWQPAGKRYMVPRAETYSNKIATSPTITGVAGGVSPSASPQGSHVSIASNHGSESSTQKKFETEVPVAAYLCEYNQTQFREMYVDDLAEFFNTHEDELGVIRWIHICSHDNPQTALMLLDGKYRLHPLAIEDVCYTPQRPKIDRYDWMLFIVAHYPQLKDEPGGLELSLNQVSIFFLKPSNVVITFEEPSASGKDGRWSHVVRERLTFSTDDIRSRDLSFLVYSILDALIDSYFPVLEFYGERIEEIEAELMDEPKPDLIKGINRLKRDMFTMRRNTWPLRDMFGRLITLPEVTSNTKMYLRDCFDHIIQIIDILEVYRDSSMGLIDIYLSGANNKMQEVMKTLTIISTIFIPLTFITGVYGMNFSFMPELEYDYGYFFFWILVIVIVSFQVYVFRKRGWL